MVNLKVQWVKPVMIAACAAVLTCVGGLAYGKIRQQSEPGIVELSAGETGQVRFVMDGDGFILTDGLKVKLAGIEAPQKAWPEQDRKGQPLADEAAQYLEDLLNGQMIGLFYGDDRRDRYDRAIAQVWTLTATGEKDLWVQEALVDAGYARVYPWTEKAYETAQLYAAEAGARKARRGIWNNRRTKSFYKVRKPDANKLAQSVDSVQIIEGVIVASADVNGTVYLNFGADYKTDFTIGIGKSARRAFTRAGIDPVSLTGAKVRVRGWMEMQNGPMIWLNAPNRLEILE